MIRKSEGEIPEVELAKFREEKEKDEALRRILAANRKNSSFLELTVTQAWAKVAQELPEGIKLSRRR